MSLSTVYRAPASVPHSWPASVTSSPMRSVVRVPTLLVLPLFRLMVTSSDVTPSVITPYISQSVGSTAMSVTSSNEPSALMRR